MWVSTWLYVTSLIGELIDMGDRTSSDGIALDGITVKYGQFYYSTIEHTAVSDLERCTAVSAVPAGNGTHSAAAYRFRVYAGYLPSMKSQ